MLSVIQSSGVIRTCLIRLNQAGIFGFHLLLACLLTVIGTGKAQATSESQASVEYQVKAGFLVNFAKFVDWPTNAVGASSRLRIGIVDDGESYSVIAAALTGKRVGPYEIETVRVKSLKDLKSFNMVFVTRSQSKQTLDVINSVRTASVLTIGETDGFAVEGGCINFIMVGNKIRFEVNTGAAESAGLKISSRLASMATIVQTNKEEPK